MSARVKKSGAACGPSVTPISHDEVSAGRRCAGVGPPMMPRRAPAGNAGWSSWEIGVGVGGSGPQHVAREQRPARVPAEAAEREGGRGSQVRRHVDPPADGQEQAEAGPVGAADRERLPGGDLERLPHRGGLAVDRDGRGCSRHRDHGRGREAQHGSVGRDLEPGRALRVADREVRLRQRDGIERAARRHADLPVAEPAGQVLHGGHGAGGDHVDARRRVVRLVESRRGVRGRAQLEVVGERPQQADVGDDAVDPRAVEGLAEEVERVVAGLARGDDLREQRVVGGGDLEAGLDPAVDADPRARRQHGLRHEAARRQGSLGRVLRVDAGLDGVAPRDPLAREEVVGQARGAVARQPQHELHEVDAVHLLGHGVLDLQARVHLEERGLLAHRVVDELDRAGAAVGDRLRERAGRVVQQRARAPPRSPSGCGAAGSSRGRRSRPRGRRRRPRAAPPRAVPGARAARGRCRWIRTPTPRAASPARTPPAPRPASRTPACRCRPRRPWP
jgi:hypothetical protein